MVSVLTALIIQGNEVKVEPYRDRVSRRWGYIVSRMERDNYRLLVTCDSIYESMEMAQGAGDDFVRAIKDLDLSKHVKGIEAILGAESDLIQAVAKASQ